MAAAAVSYMYVAPEAAPGASVASSSSSSDVDHQQTGTSYADDKLPLGRKPLQGRLDQFDRVHIKRGDIPDKPPSWRPMSDKHWQKFIKQVVGGKPILREHLPSDEEITAMGYQHVKEYCVLSCLKWY
jgi:hypothetical protein